MADLDHGIQTAREAADCTTKCATCRASALEDLGHKLWIRYSTLRTLDDLNEAILATREASNISPAASPKKQQLLVNLGVMLSVRYSRLKVKADLDEAIQTTRDAIRETPEDSPDRPGILENLASYLTAMWSSMSNMADLDEAIQISRDAIQMFPEDDPGRVTPLINLGSRLWERYSRLDVKADLEDAILTAREAAKIAPRGSPGRSDLLSNLGVFLSNRSSRLGEMADLDEAIQIARDAARMHADGHQERPGMLGNLANHLVKRYKGLGAMADLEEAISYTRQAVNACPKGDPDRVMWLNNLGTQLNEKYSRTHLMAQLEEAIQTTRDALDLTSARHPYRAALLNNLGEQLQDKYLKTEEMSVLEEAIKVTQDSVDATPKDHPDRAGRLKNLGVRLGSKYAATGEMTDLHGSINSSRDAVTLTPEDHPNRANRLGSLGTRLMSRYWKTKAMSDIQEAISCYQAASRQPNLAVMDRIQAGKHALGYLGMISDWHQAYEASNLVLPLVPRLAPRSLQNSDKQHILGQVVGLASDAAAIALHADKDPLVALNFLEQGRGVLAASLEDMRAEGDLRTNYPDLAEHFVRLQDEMAHPRTNKLPSTSEEYEQLLESIRNKRGFEDFLLAPSTEALQAAAKHGPIVIVNVSEFRCDALLVTDEPNHDIMRIEKSPVRSVPLPGLLKKDIEAKAEEGDLGNLTVLGWLWDTVAEPILDALGFTEPPSTDWPRVWWIPTGPLTRFPLHAAGRHNSSSSETVLDRVMSSYSSSVKTIIQGRRNPAFKVIPPVPDATPAPETLAGVDPSAASTALKTSNQALLVAMQSRPGYAGVRFADEEVGVLRGLCESMALEPVEPPHRRKQDLVASLPYCKIFHFAGHGHTDNVDPSQSHLLVEDWEDSRLSVATLLEMNLRERQPFLAYLSACGTGQLRNKRFVDESIHLISACQLAGYRHVIGTLWEVDDEACVDVARITYGEIRDGGLTDESVCRGLHKAARQVRDLGLGMRADSGDGSGLLKAEAPGTARVGDGEGGGRLTRRIVPEDDVNKPSYWIPYVHFGV